MAFRPYLSHERTLFRISSAFREATGDRERHKQVETMYFQIIQLSVYDFRWFSDQKMNICDLKFFTFPKFSATSPQAHALSLLRIQSFLRYPELWAQILTGVSDSDSLIPMYSWRDGIAFKSRYAERTDILRFCPWTSRQIEWTKTELSNWIIWINTKREFKYRLNTSKSQMNRYLENVLHRASSE
jgi:hypothetical protein